MIHEDARDIPVAAECDICVIGGSCTGVFAAVRAARLGAKVVVVESNGFFGGVATAGLVSIWHSDRDVAEEKTIIGGLTIEMIDRLKRRSAVVEKQSGARRHFVLNTAELMIELDELVVENKIAPFLQARFAAPITRDDAPAAVAIEDKTGRRAIKAKYFVDATGDADLIARMGLACYTRCSDHLQPPTTCAIIQGLDDVAKQNPGFSLSKVVHDPKYPNALKHGFLWSAPVTGAPDMQMVAGTRVHGADCSDADQLTRAEIEGRRQVRAICDIVRDNMKGGKALGLVALPTYIGIRETRHVECLHRLTTDEVLWGKRFTDAIANGSYPVDVHHSDKPGITFRYLDGTQRYCVPGKEPEAGRWREELAESPTFYQIPYRCLVPKGSRNVLAAGRMIDADEGAYGAIRVMVNCNQTGEAAGSAAYLALDAGLPVKDVDPNGLRETLRKGGSIVI
ncbi:MAG: FAD-dependent oxidoreductase [Planctomycetota bacterium]